MGGGRGAPADADLEVVHAWQHPTTTFGLVLPTSDRDLAEARARHVLDVAVEAVGDRSITVEPILGHLRNAAEVANKSSDCPYGS